MANFFAFPTPHHRAGRIFSRNYTTQYPSQGHHHPSTTPTGTKLSPQHPPQGATGTKLSQQHPQSTKTGHFSPARRIISRSQHRTTEQGEFSPATTPLNTHHRDTTTPTGTKPTQQRRRQRAQPGARVSTRDKTLPARPSNRSRAKKLAQQQPNLGQTAKKLSQRAQKHQNLAIFPEQGELFRVSRTNSPRRANFFAFPTPHHRAGRIFSRNNTTQHPSQGHHHPNRYKTLPATASPWPNREKLAQRAPDNVSARGTSQHARKSSPSTPSNRSRAKKLAQQQPNLGQTAKKLSQRAQKHQNLANFPEQGELFRVSQTNSPRRANFFAQIQHSTCNSGTPLARHTQQSTHTLVIERKPLVVHRLSFPLVVIHRLTRKA